MEKILGYNQIKWKLIIKVSNNLLSFHLHKINYYTIYKRDFQFDNLCNFQLFKGIKSINEIMILINNVIEEKKYVIEECGKNLHFILQSSLNNQSHLLLFED